MLRRIGMITALAAVASGIVIWKADFFGAAAKVPPTEERAADSPTVAIGKPLYAERTPAAIVPAAPIAVQAEPIVVPDCRLTVVEKQDVPSQRDGVLLCIATEIEPNQQAPAEQIV